jgi:formylglycine-generating enzyme required for sulfatase activity
MHGIGWPWRNRKAGGGSNRVKRGGSWNNNNAENLRAANRNNNTPGNSNNNIGFRCARPLVEHTGWPGCRMAACQPMPA